MVWLHGVCAQRCFHQIKVPTAKADSLAIDNEQSRINTVYQAGNRTSVLNQMQDQPLIGLLHVRAVGLLSVAHYKLAAII
jgi:hypothetical protein